MTDRVTGSDTNKMIPMIPITSPRPNTSFIRLGIMDVIKINGINPKKTAGALMLNTCEIPNEALK
ncbi:hypothetical protein D3C75_1056190 [compost metagenome]